MPHGLPSTEPIGFIFGGNVPLQSAIGIKA
jgi:hypothetical protein